MAIQMMTNAGCERSMGDLLPSAEQPTTTDWQQHLPVLSGHGMHLRELRVSDAPSLFALLTTDEVARFISPPPTTVEGFVTFIEWTHRRRAQGRHVCFAVVPDGSDTAVGLIQCHALGEDFSTAEWGFALGSAYWGSGLFAESARLMLDFVFDTLDVERLEARAVTENGRGNGALLKMGARCEATLRQSFAKGVRKFDQYLWTLLASDWREASATCARRVTVH